jgi:predicted DNA-binding transcriptional regulator AlpA
MLSIKTYITEKVTETLKVTQRTVWNLIQRGRFPDHRITASDVENFTNRQ